MKIYRFTIFYVLCNVHSVSFLLILGFGVYLTEFTIDEQVPIAIRQLSSVLLRQYVDAHWSTVSERFTPPEPNQEVCMHEKPLHVIT